MFFSLSFSTELFLFVCMKLLKHRGPVDLRNSIEIAVKEWNTIKNVVFNDFAYSIRCFRESILLRRLSHINCLMMATVFRMV